MKLTAQLLKKLILEELNEMEQPGKESKKSHTAKTEVLFLDVTRTLNALISHLVQEGDRKLAYDMAQIERSFNKLYRAQFPIKEEQNELSEMMKSSEHDAYGTPEDYAQHEISMLDHNGKKLGLKMGPDSIEVFFIDPMDGVPHYVNTASSIEELIQLLNMPQ